MHTNDQGNPAAARNLRFQNPPEPPFVFTTLFGVRSHDQNLLAILHLECHVARVNLGVLKEGLETSLYGYLGFRSGNGMVRYVSQICKAIVSDPMIATMVTEGLAVVAGELFDDLIQRVELCCGDVGELNVDLHLTRRNGRALNRL
jgi:hypothetical protein